MKKLYPLLPLLLSLSSILYPLSSSLHAQTPIVPTQPTHWMSPQEKLHLQDVLLNFQETPPPVAPVRNVAEFDRMQAVLIRYPFGIPMDLIKEMAKDIEVTTIVASTSQQNTVLSQYVSNGVDTSHCNFLIAPSDSYWTRDYGPWFESDSSNQIGIVDFPYNRPSRPNDDEIPNYVAQMMGVPRFGMNVIHTGGNYMCDGMGVAASTTLVEEENPTLTEDQIKQKVHDYLGINTYQIRPDPNNTYIDHIDCWGKFLAPDKILIRKVPPSHPQYSEIEAAAAYWETQICSYGYYYHVIRVNTPNDEPYSNSLILNNKVLLPKMGSAYDDSAIAAYQQAMPGYEVLNFTALGSAPWVNTDALHCRTMGLADVGLLYIWHVPLTGDQPAQDNFLLHARIIPCSDSAVYQDSVLIRYRVNNGPFLTAHMIHTVGQDYQGYIPKQVPGSQVDYYLYAADRSGRHATAPFMGPLDPFSFNAIYTDITGIPDTLKFFTMEECTNGKITMLHNYTSSTINMNYLQGMGYFNGTGYMVWMISPDNPPITIPYTFNPGDSLSVKVIIGWITNQPAFGYYIDSMRYTTDIATHHVVIMVSDSLYASVRNKDRAGMSATCFPNPFTQSATVSYVLTESGPVRITVLNNMGQELLTLVNEEKAAGSYQVVFNGGDLPPGIYFYRITSGKTVLTKKMLKIR
ncbi:MAG TPA: agmatine deiminase family protein [Bacteroidales bacterium]|nr:agmatine deiminase family protein [Bacteroidales bacterium]